MPKGDPESTWFLPFSSTSPTPVPTSSTSVLNAQAPSDFSPPTVEEGGEEEDMDLDDDASMITRLPLSDSDVDSDSDQADSQGSIRPLLSLLPLPWKRILLYKCSLHCGTSQPSK